ncbi:MAG TPA: aminotransferase class V-fold PLP-dependent enzyme, partial [Lacipirellulaceae bacterium]|nr:aminotransferase class V-fold PLP-dependent enzyme [Lacipirellulaceae bacterium]
ISQIHAHHTRLTARLLEGLRDVPGLTIHGPQSTANRSSVVSITVDGYDPQELAAMLDASQRIQCRAGLHCAPRMHEALGTTAGGGTLRLSPGYTTSLEEIDSVVTALQEIASISVK